MSKKIYRVAPGVPTINGRPVPASGLMSLTPAEAMFDQAHGRLEPDLPTSVPAINLVKMPDPIAAPVTRSNRRGRPS